MAAIVTIATKEMARFSGSVAAAWAPRFRVAWDRSTASGREAP
jgi:hypothetical protein